ncbi:MFS transporter [Shouchella clausii]|nr:MFS transporter [Shouchella clausii]
MQAKQEEKKGERLQGSPQKKVVAVALLTAAAVLGDSMLFIVLPLYWQEFGLTAIWQIGILLSVNRIVRLPINPLVGWFYSKFELRTGVQLSLILATATTFSYGFFQSFATLVVARVVWGIAWALLRIGGMVAVVEFSTKDNRGKLMGTYNGLWGIGGLVGMLAGGIFVEQLSVFPVTTAFATIGIMAFVFAPFVIPKRQQQDGEKRFTHARGEEKTLSPFTMLVFATGLTMGFVVFGLFSVTLSPLVERAMGGQPLEAFGVIIGAASIAGILQALRWAWDPFVAPFYGKMLDRRPLSHSWIYLPMLGIGSLFALFALLNSFWLLLGVVLIFQLLSTFFVTTADTLAARAAAQGNKVKVMTIQSVVVDVGAATGPLVSFFIVDNYELAPLYWLATVFLGVLSVFWIAYSLKMRRKPT